MESRRIEMAMFFDSFRTVGLVGQVKMAFCDCEVLVRNKK